MLEIQSGGKVTEKPSERVMVRLPLKGRASWSELSELLAGLAERAEAKAEVTKCGRESGYCDVLIWASKPELLTRGRLRRPPPSLNSRLICETRTWRGDWVDELRGRDIV